MLAISTVLILFTVALISVSRSTARMNRRHFQTMASLQASMQNLTETARQQQGALKIADDARQQFWKKQIQLQEESWALQYDAVQVLSENQLRF